MEPGWNPEDPHRGEGEETQSEQGGQQTDREQGGGYGTNGQNGYYYRSNPYANPFGWQNQPDISGQKSKTYGITGLIFSFCSVLCCPLPIAGIILGILAILRASDSRTALGMVTADASSGKLFGILAIVIGALGLLAYVIIYVIFMLGTLAAENASGSLGSVYF